MPAARRRNQARQPPGDVLAELEEMAGRLSSLGMTDQAAAVRAVMETAREDPEQASAALKDLAASIAARAPAYSHGAGKLLARAPRVLLNCEQYIH